jgi:signal transduction histidine kinase/ActR/RegA family two-component response regulator
MGGLALRYGIALVSVFLATWTRWALASWLGGHNPFATFPIAVMLTVYLAGLGPALLATFLGAVSAVYFFIPLALYSGPQGVEHLLGLALYLLGSIVVATLCESLRAARRRVETAAEAALTRQQKLEHEMAHSARLHQEVQEVNRRKDVFLAMLAHELRNPLAPIRNAVHVMRLMSPGESQLEWSRQVIERQVGHLSRLVDDLLDLSRLMRGMVKLQKKEIELALAVAHAVEASRPLIDAQGHELATRLPPEPLRLEADLTRLTQVLANLLNNAAKYTDPGGHIVLSAERDGGEVVIRVVDDGRGMPPELIPHVFDLFTQGDRTLARSEGGLGIGLTLVKSLVEMHGGRVQAQSEGSGKGSTFSIRLPLVQTPQAPEKTDSPEREPPTLVQRRRILVVDDKADAADSLSLLLRITGHEVQTVYDGPAALEAARAFRPEIVFLDIGMPGMDGYEVARRLRREPGLEHSLLVALTGYNREEDVRLCREAGFDLHLSKPADLEVVRRVISARRGGATAVEPGDRANGSLPDSLRSRTFSPYLRPGQT